MRFERLAFYLKDDEIEGDAVGEGDCPGSAGTTLRSARIGR